MCIRDRATANKTIKNTTLKKDSEYIHSSTATYTLTVNPNGENLLKDKDTITVVDQMPKIMTLLSDSITAVSYTHLYMYRPMT